ncbi:LysR family transcriptional regulator [Exilibacterium tricleocarpae]|uniref:LysR family transcriptional regulator n=1 Tax=Exilibacterium tricleocarpae TaxID=2591008 RepID=A0A545T5T3_9GAMM|nr:LysR family transcriptional regulator [Exilibacterium tricleocarpae]TQV72600.1 LysR family transcriptional regulator [Exilibacterium tricleocarpae]
MLISDLHLIVKTAELGSITRAATALDLRVATASAAIKRVEKVLGVELFVRSTRRLRLSRAGERYLPPCREALAMLERAGAEALGGERIAGELRLTVSSDFGRNLLAPWLDEWLEHHPELSLKLTLSDALLDFYRDPVDAALRYGSPEDSNLYGFKICDVPRFLYASPDYLARHPAPQHPSELSAHNSLFYQMRDVTHDVWTLTRNGERYRVRLRGDRVANDADMVRRWCVAGKGIAAKSALDMAPDLMAGRIDIVMPDYRPLASELWLVCPSRNSITPAIRLLRDYLRERCQHLLGEIEAVISSKHQNWAD